MPYIKEEDRINFNEVELELSEAGVKTAGEVQYLIALIVKEYLSDKELRYQQLNDVMGALSGAQQEFYREVVAPYEDRCITKNGEISGYNGLVEATEDKPKPITGEWVINGRGASYRSNPDNEWCL